MMEEENKTLEDVEEQEEPFNEEVTSDDTSSGQIKEKTYKFSLGMGEGSAIVHVTEKINGILQALIIDAERPVSVTIRLADFPGIVVFESTGIVGQKYCPLETQTIAEDGSRFKISTSKWALNDKLEIIVKDNINTNVLLKLRYI